MSCRRSRITWQEMLPLPSVAASPEEGRPKVPYSTLAWKHNAGLVNCATYLKFLQFLLELLKFLWMVLHQQGDLCPRPLQARSCFLVGHLLDILTVHLRWRRGEREEERRGEVGESGGEGGDRSGREEGGGVGREGGDRKQEGRGRGSGIEAGGKRGGGGRKREERGLLKLNHWSRSSSFDPHAYCT